MKFTPVAEGVYRIHLAWGNVYLLKADGRAALIDTGLEKDRGDLVGALEEVGVKPGALEAVYLTHAHCDHAGSAAWFAQQGAKIIAHTAEARYLGLPQRGYIGQGWKAWIRPHTAFIFAAGERLFPVERHDLDEMVA